MHLKLNIIRLSFFLIFLIMGVSFVVAQQNIQLKFHDNNKFKIAQFTDIHGFNANSKRCDEIIETIEFVLNKENPDLVVLTGDIVTGEPAKEGWNLLANVFIKAKVPWSVTLGNHDAEPGITRDEIFDLLETLPFFVGSKGDDLSGCGNYTLNIEASDQQKTASVIYCFDSNALNASSSIGGYDWIRFDQIDWYRKTSQAMTGNNDNLPLPSLAFFHIPLHEHGYVIGEETTVGDNSRGIGAAKINSGIFSSMLDMKDVMGVFVGHNHSNNYIGIYGGIALAFGQVTGAASGQMKRGARIIELKENEFTFDTWIVTQSETKFKYHYPSGLEYNKDVPYHEPVAVGKLKQGVSYKYYESEFTSTREVSKVKEIKSGTLQEISLSPALRNDNFALEFTAYIKIDKDDVYRFYTYSDDGSTLYINNQLIVDNDGNHGSKRVNGKIGLKKGYHKLKMRFFQGGAGKVFEAGVAAISLAETKFANNLLYIEE